MEFEKIIVEGIPVPFFDIHLFCPYISGFHRGHIRIGFRGHAIGREVWEIVYHTGFVVCLKRILAFEIQSEFFESSHEDLVEFILFPLAQRSSCILLPSRRPCFEIEDRRRKTADNRSYMRHGREIQIFQGKLEKIVGHFRLDETRWGEFVDYFQVLVKDGFYGRSFPSSKDILGIVHHAHENTEKILSGARKPIASSSHPSGRPAFSLGDSRPMFRKLSIIAESDGRIRMHPYPKLQLHITQEIGIDIFRHIG